MAKLYAPNGMEIIGTVEVIKACTCGILNEDGDVTRNPDGTFNFEYDGNGTDVNWDAQETVTNDAGHRMFWDEDYNTWPENELVLRDDEDEDDAED